MMAVVVAQLDSQPPESLRYNHYYCATISVTLCLCLSLCRYPRLSQPLASV